jgi:type IV pilus assembly protein PilF
VNNAYGWFLCNELKQPRESIQYFDKALSDPTYPAPFFAYYNKGVCYNKMDNPYQGKEYLMRALNVERSYYPAKREIARIDLGLGEVSSALQMFGEYQSQVDNMEAGDLLLGWKIARAAGHTQAAYEYEMQLQTSYPYSDELREIKTGK